MKTSPNGQAFPSLYDPEEADFVSDGLSKREYFAAMALQGLTSARTPLRGVACTAVALADLLIEELNKQEKTAQNLLDRWGNHE